MQENKSNLIMDARDKPKTSKWMVLSLQHVFAMFGATILVPILTGLPISVALFTSGVGTLIYILATKAKVPVYLGSSFAFIAPIQLIVGFTPGDSTVGLYFGSVLTGVLLVGLIYVIVAVVVKLIGTKWIDKYLPPIVIGPMIIIIGLGLASVAVGSAGFTDFGSWKEILTAIVSLLIVVVIAIKAKGFLKVVPFLMGIVGGYIFASIVGLVDFSSIGEVITTPSQWFRIPEFMFLGLQDKTVSFLGSDISFYKLNFAAAISIAPIALVTVCEHIGDHAVLSKITEKDYLKDPGLHRTLIGDGVATMFAALVGGPANTTYGENTSVVGMTKIGSVYVTGLAAIFAIGLSFINVFTTLIASIPTAVMGGISIILYGFIALNGVKVLIDNKVDFSKTRNMVIASVMLVLGLGQAVLNIWEFSIYGMALAAIVGVLINILLPKEKEATI